MTLAIYLRKPSSHPPPTWPSAVLPYSLSSPPFIHQSKNQKPHPARMYTIPHRNKNTPLSPSTFLAPPQQFSFAPYVLHCNDPTHIFLLLYHPSTNKLCYAHTTICSARKCQEMLLSACSSIKCLLLAQFTIDKGSPQKRSRENQEDPPSHSESGYDRDSHLQRARHCCTSLCRRSETPGHYCHSNGVALSLCHSHVSLEPFSLEENFLHQA